MRKEKRNKFAPQLDATLDLHGFYEDEAISAVALFLVEQKNAERVRIITGKGSGVLQKAIREWLSQEGYCFETAKITEGGAGALVIKL